MLQVAGSGCQISPAQLEMLQRVFDRVCLWCSIPPSGRRADRLAHHITHQFRNGICDETELFESAMWLERMSEDKGPRMDA